MKKSKKRKVPTIIYIALASLVLVVLAAVTVGEPLLHSDRIAKYIQLLRIEDELGVMAIYPCMAPLTR